MNVTDADVAVLQGTRSVNQFCNEGFGRQATSFFIERNAYII